LEVKVEVEMVYRIKTSIPVVSFFCESWRIWTSSILLKSNGPQVKCNCC
jgi:hypothetical protein